MSGKDERRKTDADATRQNTKNEPAHHAPPRKSTLRGAKVIRDSIDCNVHPDKMGKVLDTRCRRFRLRGHENEVLTAEEFPSEYNERLFIPRDSGESQE